MASTERLEAFTESLLLGALVLLPWAYGGAPDLARYALCTLVGLALLPWSLARAASRKPWPAFLLPALGLPALALLQLGLQRSAAPIFTAEALLLLVALLGVAVFWSERARGRKAALRLATAVLVACSAQAAFGALQWSRAPDRIYGQSTPIVTTPFGSYVNHNHFAGLLGLGVLLSAGLALGHVRQHRTVTPAGVALCGLTLALGATHLASRSRGGLLALLFGLLGLVLLQRQFAHRARAPRAWLLPLLGLALVAFGLAVVPEATRAHLLTSLAGGGDESSAYRLDIARDSLRLAAAHPLLGSGLGAFPDALPPYKRGHGEVRTTHAESDALELGAEGGLVGFLALLALCAAAWRAARERLRHGEGGLHKGLSLGALAALLALGAHSLVDFNLRLPANALVAAALLGLVAAPRESAPSPGSRWPGALLAVAFGLLALAAGWRAAGAWALTRVELRPEPLLRLRALDQTVRLHPELTEAFLQRGRLLRELAAPASAMRALRLAGAEHDLEQALRLRPQWAEAWAELGIVRVLRGAPVEARAALARARALDPTRAGLALTQAYVLFRGGDLPAALDVLAQLAEREPSWWRSALAEALRFTRDPALLERVCGNDPLRRRDLAEALAASPGG